MKLSFDDATLLYDGRRIEPSVRTYSQMRPALAFPEKECGLAPDSPTYFMYRAAESFGRIRYDITRILSLDLCSEKNKTFGHSHPISPKGAAWPEIYEVLSGSAHFLLQKTIWRGVEDAVVLSGKKGDCLLIPPGYGHVTINPGREELVLANLVSGDFESDYSLFAQRRGACFYELSDGKLVKNGNYGTDFELRRDSAVKFSSAFACFGPFRGSSLLKAAKNRADIEFLEKPETFY